MRRRHPLRLLHARQDVLETVLLRLHRGVPLAVGRLLGLLELVQHAFLVVQGPFQGRVVLLHVKERLFHDCALCPYAWYRVRCGDHRSRDRR
jgi:hypothetical protein